MADKSVVTPDSVVLEEASAHKDASFEPTNYEDEDDEDLELEGGDMEVELGFLGEKEAHLYGPFGEWDGGKVGGSPVWLHPNTHVDVKCSGCDKNMSFLLQIYCPLDHPEQAFHRSLARTFRSQLPQDNLYYANHEDINYRPLDHVNKSLHRCALCGLKATFSCSACHIAHYCSKEHQKDHWKHGHKQDCPQCLATHELFEDVAHATALEDNGSKFLFPEYAIHIDPEPATTEAKMMHDFEQAQTSRRVATNDDVFTDDSAIDISQKDLSSLLGSSPAVDKTYLAFLTRVAMAKDQVLRYCRWNIEQDAVLWVHSTDRPTDVPVCAGCGEPRLFEFQVMPQLLYHLKLSGEDSIESLAATNAGKHELDWGTLVVYTCPNSCSQGRHDSAELIEEFSPEVKQFIDVFKACSINIDVTQVTELVDTYAKTFETRVQAPAQGWTHQVDLLHKECSEFSETHITFDHYNKKVLALREAHNKRAGAGKHEKGKEVDKLVRVRRVAAIFEATKKMEPLLSITSYDEHLAALESFAVNGHAASGDKPAPRGSGTHIAASDNIQVNTLSFSDFVGSSESTSPAKSPPAPATMDEPWGNFTDSPPKSSFGSNKSSSNGGFAGSFPVPTSFGSNKSSHGDFGSMPPPQARTSNSHIVSTNCSSSNRIVNVLDFASSPLDTSSSNNPFEDNGGFMEFSMGDLPGYATASPHQVDSPPSPGGFNPFAPAPPAPAFQSMPLNAAQHASASKAGAASFDSFDLLAAVRLAEGDAIPKCEATLLYAPVSKTVKDAAKKQTKKAVRNKIKKFKKNHDGAMGLEFYLAVDADLAKIMPVVPSATTDHTYVDSLTGEQIQASLLALIPAETILVGHSLENDLSALRLIHRRLKVKRGPLFPSIIAQDSHPRKLLTELAHRKKSALIIDTAAACRTLAGGTAAAIPCTSPDTVFHHVRHQLTTGCPPTFTWGQAACPAKASELVRDIAADLPPQSLLLVVCCPGVHELKALHKLRTTRGDPRCTLQWDKSQQDKLDVVAATAQRGRVVLVAKGSSLNDDQP
ncbi:hypothetical protein DYB30_005700 [Aphanomyces astaci]|uniref:MYND-type domain-containing protein n=1 Tax=Aphanomyces astaci TaxID=112090 RepID=A0A397CQU8_APHAT|nr:hypothetical protein DYB30_005700 [Aphanomyces astaci]